MVDRVRKTFDETLRDAMNDLETHGYDSAERVQQWQEMLRRAAEDEFMSRAELHQRIRDHLEATYRRTVDRGGVLTRHPGVARFTLEKVKPHLRQELERRILASADLIELNRPEMVAQTLRRFSGWATSIPAGGSNTVDKPEERAKIRKSMSGLPFIERRVLIDQGHKLEAAVSEIVATGGGAIAAYWRSHYQQANYDFRSEHKQRAIQSAKLPYVVRDNWAIAEGLMKLAGSKYIDEMTKPGEEVFCRCWYEFIYNLRDLPAAMITAKGKAMMEQARARVRARMSA